MVSYTDAIVTRQRCSKTFNTKKEARKWVNQIESQIFSGTDFNAGRQNVSVYFKEWMTIYKLPHIRKSTATIYQTNLHHIESMFGNLSINKLTTPYLQQKINQFAETHSHTTTANLWKMLKAALKAAHADGILQRDIYSRIHIAGKVLQTKTNYLSASEFKTLQKFLYMNSESLPSNHYYLASLIALETGARFGEIMALTPADIDFTNNKISISKSYSNRTREITEPKNNSSIRTITITNELSALMSRLWTGFFDTERYRTPKIFQNPDFSLKRCDFWVFL